MKKLKFIKKKDSKKIYFLKISNTKKTSKVNYLLNIGNYSPNIKLYTFIYFKIISLLKLNTSFSKQSSLLSLFYLKNCLKKNLQ